MPHNKNLAVFDIDKTLTREFLVVPLLKSEEESGFLPSGTYDEVLKLLGALKHGKLEYEDAAHRLLVLHAAGLKGQKYIALENHAWAYIQEHKELFRNFSSPVITLLKQTHQIVAVTAEPDYMAKAVVEVLNMDSALTSEYATNHGEFTGTVQVSLAHRNEKGRLIGALRPDFAFGDSVGDIEMLSHSQYAYCISPDAALITKAHENKWEVFNGDSDTKQIITSLESRLQ